MAKEWGRGLLATSAPRTLSSQAIESGALSTAAAAPFSVSRAAIVCRFSPSFDAREAHRVGADGAKRRRRLVVPHRVDGVVLAWDEARANGLARRRQPVAAVRAVQPGVVAERGIRRKVAPQPRAGRARR